MAQSPESILNFLPLTSAVESIKTGIPKVLPEAFWTTKESVLGDKANYIEYTGTRQVARVVPYGSPPRQTTKVSVSDKSVRLLHAHETMPFTQEMFNVFRQWEEYRPQQMRFMQNLDHQARQFRQRFDNLRVAAVTMTLATGLLYFDVDGNLLPSSSSAVLTIDQGVPAGNKDQVSGIIGASWATAATDIVSDIVALKQRAVQLTGYPLKYAFYGANIPGYLAANTTVQNFMARNAIRNEKLLSTGEIPPQLFGLEWVPVYEGFYEDSGGTNRTFFPADNVTFGPEINKSTYCLFEGSYPVPSTFGIFSDPMAALRSMKDVYGMGRFAQITPGMTGLQDVAFDTFLPVLRVPNAWIMADVVP